MQSKTSWFHKAIFFKNLTRWWPIWTAYLLVWLIRLPLRLFHALDPRFLDTASASDNYLLTQLEYVVRSSLQPSFFFLFAAITAIAVFSYLFQAKSCNMMHALPVCRETLFTTNLLSGLAFLAIPQTMAFLAGIFVCFFRHMTQLEYLMHWLILSLGMVFFAYALAIFTVMITGNIIAAPVFYIIINYLFVVCRSIVCQLAELVSFGADNTSISFGDFLSPFFYFSTLFPGFLTVQSQKELIGRTQAYACIGAYCIAGIILLFLAFFLYRKKHLETAGDIITISFLKPLFCWGASFTLGCWIAIMGQSFFVGEYVSGINFLLLLFFLAAGCIFVFFLAEMLLQKSFFIFCKRKFLECAGVTLLSCLFLTCLEYNLFGIETRIPREEDIQSIFLSGIYPIRPEETDFAKVLDIHQDLIDSRKELQHYFQKYRDNCSFSTLELTYTMKNGSVQKRLYRIPVDDYYLAREDYAFNLLTELSYNPEYYLRYHFTDAYESVTFIEGNMDIYEDSDFMKSASLNQEQCIRLFQALKKDIYEGNYQIYDYALNSKYADHIYYNTLTLTYKVPKGSTYVYYKGIDTVTDTSSVQAAAISLTDKCKHTLAALKELGVLDPERHLITQRDAQLLYEDEPEDAAVYH